MADIDLAVFALAGNEWLDSWLWVQRQTFQTESGVTSCSRTSTGTRHTPNLNFPIKSTPYTHIHSHNTRYRGLQMRWIRADTNNSTKVSSDSSRAPHPKLHSGHLFALSSISRWQDLRQTGSQRLSHLFKGLCPLSARQYASISIFKLTFLRTSFSWTGQKQEKVELKVETHRGNQCQAQTFESVWTLYCFIFSVLWCSLGRFRQPKQDLVRMFSTEALGRVHVEVGVWFGLK